MRAARRQEQLSRIEITRHSYEAAAAARHGKADISALHQAAVGSWAELGRRAALVRESSGEAHDTRCQWEAMTEPTRRIARAADIELKRRGVLHRDDELLSAEPEGFTYPTQPTTADVWVQPRLDGTIDQPCEPEPEPPSPPSAKNGRWRYSASR